MYVLITTIMSGERTSNTSAPFADEAAGRTAWLAATRNVNCTYAALQTTTLAPRIRVRCEWSSRGTFVDLTDTHRDELVALCAELTQAAPRGYSASLGEDEGAVIVLFEGAAKPHSLQVAYSTADRIRAHWGGYLPEAA